jgi:hypothetical protein
MSNAFALTGLASFRVVSYAKQGRSVSAASLELEELGYGMAMARVLLRTFKSVGSKLLLRENKIRTSQTGKIACVRRKRGKFWCTLGAL